jgi:hypothetical protein
MPTNVLQKKCGSVVPLLFLINLIMCVVFVVVVVVVERNLDLFE